MAHRGWLESDWGISDNNRRAKFYQLTQRTFTAIGTGLYRTCALTTGGEVYCWGDRPELLDAPGQRFQTVSIAIHTQCCVTIANKVLCGEGRWNDTPTSNVGASPASISPSGFATDCGLTADGSAYCGLVIDLRDYFDRVHGLG